MKKQFRHDRLLTGKESYELVHRSIPMCTRKWFYAGIWRSKGLPDPVSRINQTNLWRERDLYAFLESHRGGGWSVL